jgi:hypothetical protein
VILVTSSGRVSFRNDLDYTGTQIAMHLERLKRLKQGLNICEQSVGEIDSKTSERYNSKTLLNFASSCYNQIGILNQLLRM